MCDDEKNRLEGNFHLPYIDFRGGPRARGPYTVEPNKPVSCTAQLLLLLLHPPQHAPCGMQNARTCSPSSFLRIHTWLGPHSLGQELPLLQQTVWICPSYRLWLLACSQPVLPRWFPAQTRRLCRITGVHCSEANVSFLLPIQVDRHTISCQHTFEGAMLMHFPSSRFLPFLVSSQTTTPTLDSQQYLENPMAATFRHRILSYAPCHNPYGPSRPFSSPSRLTPKTLVRYAGGVASIVGLGSTLE